jgi:hypothetical protein
MRISKINRPRGCRAGCLRVGCLFYAHRCLAARVLHRKTCRLATHNPLNDHNKLIQASYGEVGCVSTVHASNARICVHPSRINRSRLTFRLTFIARGFEEVWLT